MRRVLVIGMGAGSPDHLTAEAMAAIRGTDVFFVIDKGSTAPELRELRAALIERYATTKPYRIVTIAEADRDRTPNDYEAAVGDWHRERAVRIGKALAGELGGRGVGAFLVWGDPSLYDSTLRILDQVRATGAVEFEHEVIPGVSSLHALAAAHRISLHAIGEPVLVTTGRRLAADLATGVPNTVVMLDGQEAFAEIDPEGLDIYWAAYLGTPHELTVSGDLAEVAPTIIELRRAAREERGWIMDIYLLRRRPDPPTT